MNEEQEKKVRSGAQPKTVEEKKIEEVVPENGVKNIKPLENNKEEKNKDNKKREKKKINKRLVALIVVVILVITTTILLVILKVKSLKEKYNIPNKENNVFEEKANKQSDDLKYVADFDYFYEPNCINYETIYYVDGKEFTEIENNNRYKLINESNIYKDYIKISGLKNKEIENKINNTIKSTVMDINDAFEGKTAVYCNVTGNFGDVLSLCISCIGGNTDYNYGYVGANIIKHGLNFDLNTGELIKFEDLFTSSAPIAPMLLEACLKYEAWAINYRDEGSDELYNMDNRDFSNEEEYALEVANLYKKMKGSIDFNFSTTYIQINNFMPDFISGTTGVNMEINMRQYKDYIAIYKRFESNEDIYEQKYLKDKVIPYSIAFPNTYYYNRDNIFLNFYLPVDVTEKVDCTNDIERLIINPVLNMASSNKDKRYVVDGYVYGHDFIKQTYTYESDDSIKNNYLYTIGSRYEMTLYIDIEQLDYVDDKTIGDCISAASYIKNSGGGRPVFRTLSLLSEDFLRERNITNFKNINYVLGLSEDVFRPPEFYYDAYGNYITSSKDLPSIEEMKNYLNQLGIDSRS